MSLTPMPLYCSEWGCQQIEAHKSYPVKAGGVRRLYYCPDCQGYFSETPNTPLANLKTPLSRIAVCASLHMMSVETCKRSSKGWGSMRFAGCLG
jgi:hypothetical protein